MARSRSHLRVTGTIEDMIYYRNRLAGGIVGRRKDVGLSERVSEAPNYFYFRQHGSMFGFASHACKVLRDCLAPAVRDITDNSMNTRLIAPAKRIVSKAASRGMNEHPFQTEDADIFRGFSFNGKARLLNVLTSSLESGREGGKFFVKMKKATINRVKGSTHFQVVSSVGGIDFIRERCARNDEASEMLEASEWSTDITLETELPGSYPVYYHVVTVRQFQLVNGTYSPLYNLRGNAADIVQVVLNQEE